MTPERLVLWAFLDADSRAIFGQNHLPTQTLCSLQTWLGPPISGPGACSQVTFLSLQREQRTHQVTVNSSGSLGDLVACFLIWLRASEPS